MVTLRSPWPPDRGADVNAKNRHDRTALHIASEVTLRLSCLILKKGHNDAKETMATQLCTWHVGMVTLRSPWALIERQTFMQNTVMASHVLGHLIMVTSETAMASWIGGQILMQRTMMT
jgi:hypothetical protein